jgi:HrpA-like RNA helicase
MEHFDAYKTRISFETDLPEYKELESKAEQFLADCSKINMEHAGSSGDLNPSSLPSLNQRTPQLRLKDALPLQGSLPIYQMAKEILESVQHNQVTILSATTGSGKTTQIPKIILHHFENASIVVTQPRRVAAISLAERLAHEIDMGPVGSSVGYCVRFDAKYPSKTDSNICKFNF